MNGRVHIGVAGWALPSPSYEPGPGFAPRLPLARFGEEGSHLERYARVYSAVEINSAAFLDDLAEKIASLRDRAEVWCIFDNTAQDFAQVDALGLIDRLAAQR